MIQASDPQPSSLDGAPEEPTAGSLVRALPGMARIAAIASWNAAGWTMEASLNAGSRLMRAALSGEPPTDVLRDAREEARKYTRRLLGILDGREQESGDAEPMSGPEAAPPRSAGEAKGGSLRRQGAELLRRSADVHFEEDHHPAYERILEQLAPDEARILRLLAREGPQPAVDVRSGVPVLASELVAPGLSMIGAEAGCRQGERVHAYLNNLYRLGLIWFSREPVAERLRYQVLEAQPEVADALREAGRTGRTVRRSIHLTPFGEDFCQLCLPLETAEIEVPPGAGPPPEPEAS